MKKFIFAITAMFAIALSAKAMSYEQAREQALFLTDKMAYELNLTDDQYEAAYEVNLDYLMNINVAGDLYTDYWRRRNLDLGYILFDWQYRLYCAAEYFYRPLYWDAGFWHFRVYSIYPHRDYFYFGRPTFFFNYRGGHSWRHNGGHSWYHGRTFGHGPGGNMRDGMRDGWNRGDFNPGGRHFTQQRFQNSGRDREIGRAMGNNNGRGNMNQIGRSRNTNQGGNGMNQGGRNTMQIGRNGNGTMSNGSRIGRESSTRSTVNNWHPRRWKFYRQQLLIRQKLASGKKLLNGRLFKRQQLFIRQRQWHQH